MSLRSFLLFSSTRTIASQATSRRVTAAPAMMPVATWAVEEDGKVRNHDAEAEVEVSEDDEEDAVPLPTALSVVLFMLKLIVPFGPRMLSGQ